MYFNVFQLSLGAKETFGVIKICISDNLFIAVLLIINRQWMSRVGTEHNEIIILASFEVK